MEPKKTTLRLCQMPRLATRRQRTFGCWHTCVTMERELPGSSRNCFTLRLFPFTCTQSDRGPPSRAGSTQPATSCLRLTTRPPNLQVSADPPQDVVDAFSRQQRHEDVLQTERQAVRHTGRMLEVDRKCSYLLASVHGDGQAVGHQAGSLVFLHQSH